MSALGQKQTCAVQNVMSALPPKADICGAQARCPLSANSGHSCLFSYQGRQPRQLRCIGPANAQRIDRTLLD